MFRFLALTLLFATILACTHTRQHIAADLIFSNATVYQGRHGAAADTVAITADQIVYVGDKAGVAAYRARSTREIDLKRRLLIPGLHDVHIHPLGIVSPGGCDLDTVALTLTELVPRLRQCIDDGAVDESGWLIVSQWNFTSGNQPSNALPTMRAALDAVSTTVPILLLGNDGHHGAANSATLSRATNEHDQLVGLSRETLNSEFAEYAAYVGVDELGEPNGYVNETARALFGVPVSLFYELPAVSAMPSIAKKLASYGITSIRDAATLIATLPLYDSLYESGDQTFRLTLALYPKIEDYADKSGNTDISQIVADMSALRTRYHDHPLIRADTVKLFVDGVLEGDPLSIPPTLPNGAQLRAYQQPLFNKDGQQLSIGGYVELHGSVCVAVRENPGEFKKQDAIDQFIAVHGYHPGQCKISTGVLEYPLSVIEDYIVAFDAAGFTVHAHAIGDRAVRTAIDAFEKVRLRKGHVVLPHGLAHVQLIDPDDIPRVGRLGLNIAFTYAWIVPSLDYDLTVVPFIDAVDIENLYNPANYSYRYAYPTASLWSTGTMLTAGSDAPVETREPRPFENIEQAVTRANDNGDVYNSNERIDIYTILDAYTINGAVALNQSLETGSIAVGKKADLAILDRNVIELANKGMAADIGDTKVLMTVFDGRIVYTSPGFAVH